MSDYTILDCQQGSRTFLQYAIEFRSWVYETEWDDNTLKATFRRGLSEHLKDKLTALPIPDTLEDLIALCATLEHQIQECRAESNRARTRRPMVKPLAPKFQTPVTTTDSAEGTYGVCSDIMKQDFPYREYSTLIGRPLKPDMLLGWASLLYMEEARLSVCERVLDLSYYSSGEIATSRYCLRDKLHQYRNKALLIINTRTMPRKERVQNKELFGPWLLRQIDSNLYDGVFWLNKEKTLFRIPWKHLNMKSKDERDYGIFKAWAIESGKYIESCENPTTWKTNFRCALNGVVYRDIRMFSEVEDNSNNQQDPHKIYRVNCVRAVPLKPAVNSCATNTAATVPVEQNIPEDDDYTLRISPDKDCVLPFEVIRNEEDLLEVLENFCLDGPDTGTFGYSGHNNLQPITNGFLPSTTLLVQVSNTPLYQQGAQHNRYNSENEHQQVGPCVGHVFTSPIDTTSQVPNEYMTNPIMLEPVPSVINGFETTLQEAQPSQPTLETQPTQPAQETQSTQPALETQLTQSALETQPPQPALTVPPHQSQLPHITSWEVTIFYKGKQVLQTSVSKRFIINSGFDDPQWRPADIVCFPSADDLVDQTQVRLTKTILDNVGGGLLLEVNPQDYKLYAKRLGKSRVYWSMSQELETMGNADESKLIKRQTDTEIFDFNKFWEDLLAYRSNRRSSPDYTVYMCFGQELCNPIMRRLVLVKLVPHFGVYLHEMVQREGASSLNQESISLQISNGNSFNSPDFDLCLMDIDFSCLL
ncbi:interferon regulatory factor 7 [Rhinophrynus dorsalis]